MKVKAVTIEGMHNVNKRRYEFCSNVSYIHGKNGAGKSTILQAIQLALLGYIPDKNKTKESIFHNANGRAMAVTLELEDSSGEVTTIERSWTNTGKSIASFVLLNGQECKSEQDISNLVGEIELPVFNFNEFVGMTANKLKDWFISFLPDDETSVNWEDKLKESLGDTELIDSSVLTDAIAEAANCKESGVDAVRHMNSYFKNLLSFKKSELTRVQSTIQSLIYFDDCDNSMTEEELKAEIQKLNALKDSLMSDMSAIKHNADIQAELDKYVDEVGDIEQDEEYKQALEVIKSCIDERDKLTAELSETDKQKHQAQMYLDSHNKLLQSKGVCTYTGKVCDSIVASFEGIRSKDIELRDTIAKCTEKHADLTSKINALNLKVDEGTQFVAARRAAHDNAKRLKSLLVPVTSTSSLSDINLEIADVTLKIQKAEDTWVKVQANNKYNKLIEDLTKQKFAVEQTIEVLKIWGKLTDANGLQSDIMVAPFISFANAMNKYVPVLFGPDVNAAFNLENKANSFSFGIVRDARYIPFDLLSSGEKCMYTVLLMICITKQSNSKLSTILIDDLFDHLDDSNISALFQSLDNIEDIQFIVAGVKDYKSHNTTEI